MIGGEALRFLAGEETRDAAGPQQPVIGHTGRAVHGRLLTLGRDRSNDVVLEDPNVSRFHAEVARVDGRVAVRDLASRNGTRVNGELVRQAVLEPGSEIGIGPYSLIFDGAPSSRATSRARCASTRSASTMQAGDKQILAETTLSIEPGQLVAFIGESGLRQDHACSSARGSHDSVRGSVA